MTEEGGDVLETRYRALVSRQAFSPELKQYNLYYGQRPNQQLQMTEAKGMPVVYGLLKLYWGTQRVIRLKKEELSWKRKSTRIAYENGLDEKLMHAMGSGARNRRSLTKLRDSVSEIPEESAEADQEQESNGVSSGKDEEKMSAAERLRMSHSLPRDGMNNTDVIAEIEKAEKEGRSLSPEPERHDLSLPRKVNLRRRTMSFSGHFYNTKTRVFRPRYGTLSTVRVSSTQATLEVIKLLLTKFAVENPAEEFSLFSVSTSGGTQELKNNDFPLLRRIQLGPDENVAKIFIMERKTTTQVSPEVAQYVNLPFTVLESILKKYSEEENKEADEIRKKYSLYRATLQKKLDVIIEATNQKAKDREKKKHWWN